VNQPHSRPEYTTLVGRGIEVLDPAQERLRHESFRVINSKCGTEVFYRIFIGTLVKVSRCSVLLGLDFERSTNKSRHHVPAE
jgi:hypothetical protein